MQISRLNHPLRAVAVLAVVAVALLLSGCSLSQRGAIQKNVSETDLANGNEPYFDVGGLTFQVQVSGQINPFGEQSIDFAGVKDALTIPPSDFWFGVYLWAKNQNKRTLRTPSQQDFTLTDSSGNTYLPVILNPQINGFAWTSQSLEQDAIEPSSGSIAGTDSAGGGLILFKLPQSVYQNRPLTLHIYPYGERHSARKHVASAVSMDL